MRPSRFVRTTAFRLTLIYIGVFSASIIVLSAAVYFGAAHLWEADVREIVTAEIETLQATHERDGPTVLMAAVKARSKAVHEEGYIYQLQDSGGTRIAGLLEEFEAEEGWQWVVPPDGEEDEPFIADIGILPGGYMLVVGHDAHDLHERLEFIEEGLAWTFGITFPFALLGGLLISAITVRRIEAINRTTLRIRSGRLDDRIAVAGTNDEFDRLATSINSMLDGIRDLTEGLRQVTNDIAHDMRTPLTRVRQRIERARDKPETPAQLADDLGEAIAEIDSLLAAFGALLRIAQIESGTRRSGFHTFDLSEVFRKIVEDFEVVAEDDGKRLISKIDNGIVYFGDSALIVQMIVNLVENAICHTPVGAAISVELSSDTIDIEAVVADNGPGIPDDLREKVFNRFYRVNQSRHTPGSGLGLNLVAAVATLHDMDVTLVDNEPGLRVVLKFRSEK